MDVGLVCDACSALTPIGVPQCTRCGASVALDPRPKQQSKPPPVEATAPNPCSKCGTMVMSGQRFCPNCGNRIVIPLNFDVETRVGPRPAVQPVVPAKDNTRDTRDSRDSRDSRDPRDRKDRKDPKPGRNTLFFGGAVQS